MPRGWGSPGQGRRSHSSQAVREGKAVPDWGHPGQRLLGEELPSRFWGSKAEGREPCWDGLHWERCHLFWPVVGVVERKEVGRGQQEK